eukprot:156595-Chlamydomonas_euryale.AAC.6
MLTTSSLAVHACDAVSSSARSRRRRPRAGALLAPMSRCGPAGVDPWSARERSAAHWTRP